MGIVSVGMLGVLSVILAILLKNTRPEYSLMISFFACLFILLFGIEKIKLITDEMKMLAEKIQIQGAYFKILLKIVGITYVSQFAGDLCEDAGFHAISGEIQMFGKLSILVISIPIISALMNTVVEFLG